MGKRYKDSLQPLGDKIGENQLYVNHGRVEIILSYLWKRDGMQINIRQPIAVSDISVYICLIDIRDGSCKPVYGGVDHLQALSSAKTGRRSCFFMN